MHFNHQYILNGKQYPYCVKCGHAFSKFRKVDCRSVDFDRDDSWIHNHLWQLQSDILNTKVCIKCNFETLDPNKVKIPCPYPDEIILLKEIIK